MGGAGMGLAVVRCPACRGLSRVEDAAVGLTVQCPLCPATFEAVEEPAPAIPARPPRNPDLPADPPRPPRPRRRRRPAPERYDREWESDAEPRPGEPRPAPEPTADPEHDPHLVPPGPLPASVLIGLALLPLGIPILWLVGPALFGAAPILSVAVPVALAVAAAVLCVSVIYTIDWTPATRVKGVLILVGLAYFAGVSLYFLKKETVDRVSKLWAGTGWVEVNRGDCSVKMPHPPRPAADQVVQSVPVKCSMASHKTLLGD